MVKRAAAPVVKFGSTRVPPEVLAAGVRALEHFNARTGRECRAFTERGKPSESLKRILGAMLDYPEVRDLAPAMIDGMLRRPWWTGPASTGVIFGPGVVERAIAAARRTPVRAGVDARRAILDVARRRGVPAELAGEVLRSEGQGEAAARVERDGLATAVAWAHAT